MAEFDWEKSTKAECVAHFEQMQEAFEAGRISVGEWLTDLVRGNLILPAPHWTAERKAFLEKAK